MKNCKDIEHLIIDFVDDQLSISDKQIVESHIKNCETCKTTEQDYRLLFGTIDVEKPEYPDKKIKDAFNKALIEAELTILQKNNSKPSKTIEISFQTIYKMVAVVALMAGSYWFGNYNTKKKYTPKLASLRSEKQELKRLTTLSLFESESASKHIQAVGYSQELDNPDDDILNALVNEMLHNKFVNVRLASARALMRFSEYRSVKDAFIEALKSEKNTSMQIELIEILVRIKEKRAIPKMEELLNNENTPIFIKDQLKTELQNLI